MDVFFFVKLHASLAACSLLSEQNFLIISDALSALHVPLSSCFDHPLAVQLQHFIVVPLNCNKDIVFVWTPGIQMNQAIKAACQSPGQLQ